MKNYVRFSGRRQGQERRRATAVVEFAVVLPLLMTMVLGIIEFGYVFMVRQTLQHAAREGCRVAILQTSVNPYANVTARVADAISPTGLNTYSVTMTHATVVDPVETIEVTVPYADVSLVGGYFGFSGGTLRGSCSMRKEGSQ